MNWLWKWFSLFFFYSSPPNIFKFSFHFLGIIQQMILHLTGCYSMNQFLFFFFFSCVHVCVWVCDTYEIRIFPCGTFCSIFSVNFIFRLLSSIKCWNICETILQSVFKNWFFRSKEKKNPFFFFLFLLCFVNSYQC